MENGRIVEQGTHDELLGSLKGAYFALYNSQFTVAVAEEDLDLV